MNLILHEYNVTPDVTKREEVSIQIAGGTVLYNGKSAQSAEFAEDVEKLIASAKKPLMQCKGLQPASAKGGRQKMLAVTWEELGKDTITLFGNTNNQEVAAFYNELTKRIIAVVEKYTK